MMQDKLCKICYKCELPFTMYRRRHHCRMCGQIFCNQCSSFYIEQGVVGQTVRCCRLCYDQLGASYDQDVKHQLPLEKRIHGKGSLAGRRLSGLSPPPSSIRVVGGDGDSDGQSFNQHQHQSNQQQGSSDSPHYNQGSSLSPSHPPTNPSTQSNNQSQGQGQGQGQGNSVVESPVTRENSLTALQQRASSHLISIVHLLVTQSTKLKALCSPDLLSTWETIIVKLVREVVNYVDPDVRSGDSLDIRPYVKLNVIPGGDLTDNAFINGVVFRKNVSHKKMAHEKFNPRLLLLGGVSTNQCINSYGDVYNVDFS
jgi:1-phosphatidylinositol-3-phosphate 5-kinase